MIWQKEEAIKAQQKSEEGKKEAAQVQKNAATKRSSKASCTR